MSEHQLDHSLTSMEWLSRLTTNKQLLEQKGAGAFNFFPNSSNSNSSDGCFNTGTQLSPGGGGGGGGDIDPILIDKLAFSSIGSTKPAPTKKVSKEDSTLKELKNNANKSNANTNANMNVATLSSSAQRAEPHRPVDLSAEYRGSDLGRREGKPPYSYVNLITFAINSTAKKRMTLNEIYQWISDNFHYYRKAGNGWKVLIF